ncbi:MAG: type II toxin-antitoxin system VapC family toxin [Acidobacteria bacterium]|nr:type II toxin-antitoxin system VapC family toxin [Acidobacteriota bacterium]
MTPYVLDTSALLALFDQEEGALQVLEIVRNARGQGQPGVYLPFMSSMEFEYVALRRFGNPRAEEALRMIRAWPVERCESHPEWASRAARIKVRGGLSTADAWNAALALMLEAELVHKDPEFDQVPGLKHCRLPYKKP